MLLSTNFNKISKSLEKNSLLLLSKLKVAREEIVDSDEDISADRLKNAAATKKLAIFDAFEILKRIEEEKQLIEGNDIVKNNTPKGFAESRSR